MLSQPYSEKLEAKIISKYKCKKTTSRDFFRPSLLGVFETELELGAFANTQKANNENCVYLTFKNATNLNNRFLYIFFTTIDF